MPKKSKKPSATKIPPRPKGVPDGATWKPDSKEWYLGKMVRGKAQGAFTFWRADGSLCSKIRFEDDVLHGLATRFHETGEASGEVHYDHGKVVGTNRWFRASGPTTEPWLEPFPSEKIRRVEQAHHPEGITDGRAFDAKGRELLPDGTPCPTRPKIIPAEATYDERTRRWSFGYLDPSTAARLGSWSEWTPKGELYNTRAHVAGKPHGVERYFHANGAVSIERTFVRGELEGPYRQYTEKGELKVESAHEKGKEHGPVVHYDAKGRVVLSGRFERGTKVGTWNILRGAGPIEFPAAADAVVRAEIDYVDTWEQSATRYFDAKDDPVSREGKPLASWGEEKRFAVDPSTFFEGGLARHLAACEPAGRKRAPKILPPLDRGAEMFGVKLPPAVKTLAKAVAAGTAGFDDWRFDDLGLIGLPSASKGNLFEALVRAAKKHVHGVPLVMPFSGCLAIGGDHGGNLHLLAVDDEPGGSGAVYLFDHEEAGLSCSATSLASFAYLQAVAYAEDEEIISGVAANEARARAGGQATIAAELYERARWVIAALIGDLETTDVDWVVVRDKQLVIGTPAWKALVKQAPRSVPNALYVLSRLALEDLAGLERFAASLRKAKSRLVRDAAAFFVRGVASESHPLGTPELRAELQRVVAGGKSRRKTGPSDAA